jgi:hypothetical protein
LLAIQARNAHAGHVQAVVPKPKEGVGTAPVPAAEAAPNPPPNTDDGFAVSPAGLLRPLPPNSPGVDAPDVAPPPPPKRPPGLLAGVLDAPPPKRFDEPAGAPPPNRPEPPGVLAPVFPVLEVPNIDGAVPPDVLLAAPNNGLFGVLPPLCCPKVKDMMRDCVRMRELFGVVDAERASGLCRLTAEETAQLVAVQVCRAISRRKRKQQLDQVRAGMTGSVASFTSRQSRSCQKLVGKHATWVASVNRCSLTRLVGAYDASRPPLAPPSVP